MQNNRHVRVSCLVAVCLTLVSAAPLRAQIFESVGTRAQGMGGAFVAVADDATATWWNPAGLAGGAYFSSLIEVGRHPEPVSARSRAFAIAYPALGFSYYRFDLAGLPVSGPAAATAASRQDGEGINVFGLTAGQSLGNHFVLASTVKLARALEETHGDLDVGVMASAGPLRAGLALKNLRRPVFVGGGEQLEVPRQARAGLALRGGPMGRPTWTLAVDADLSRTPTVIGDERHLAAGAEAWVSQRQLGVRVGIGTNTVGERRTSASVGASLAFRAGLLADFQVTRGHDDIRNGWSFGLRVTL